MLSLKRSSRDGAFIGASGLAVGLVAIWLILISSEVSSETTSREPPPATTDAQMAVLVEEFPVPAARRLVGSVRWRAETAPPGPGLPAELMVRADVEVPERKLAMIWSLRRNTDQTLLPASHTIELVFKLPADFPSGGIADVPGILVKPAERTRGVALAGLSIKVVNGFHMIGLSDLDKTRNLLLLKQPGWLDIPLVYNDNRRAILAIEKGPTGDRAFAEAFATWGQ